jgi:hypothetical protein
VEAYPTVVASKFAPPAQRIFYGWVENGAVAFERQFDIADIRSTASLQRLCLS